MLGGGTFLVQNKVLNGAYINFVSAKNSNFIFGDRGFVAMGIDMDWGKEGEIITVESADIQTNSMKIFGYAYDAPEMKGLRDLFIHAKTAYLYRLNGGGTKAANDYATAKYAGTRGNALKLVIRANVDNEDAFDVEIKNTVAYNTVKYNREVYNSDYKYRIEDYKQNYLNYRKKYEKNKKNNRI